MLGFVVAKQNEALAILNDILDKKQKKLSSKVIIEGRMGLEKVVMIISGPGKVNAAIATQVLIDNYPKLDLIINYGVATALSKKVDVGACYLVKRVIQSDFNLTFDNENIGLLEEYEKALPMIANKYTKLINREDKVINLATQDTLPNKDLVTRLKEQDILAVDMECGAVLQVCKLNCKPLICFKAINGRLGDNLTTTDKNNNIAISNLQEAIENLLEVF